jgi:hypothetical protein
MRYGVVILVACARPPEGLSLGECTDYLDNDVDGLVDCFDPDCILSGQCGVFEGMNPGECTDSIDNDGNGLTDCQDPGCAAVCNNDFDGTPDPTPSDPTPSNPTDEPPVSIDPEDQDCTEPLGSFARTGVDSIRLTWRLDIDLASICDQLCGLSPVLCDCSSTYEFNGTLVASGSGLTQYQGSWEQTSTTCQTAAGVSGNLVDTFIWRSEQDPSAFMTVWWEEGATAVTEYTVHQDAEDCEPLEDGWLQSKQLFEEDVDAPFDESTNSASRTETVTTTVDMCEANFTSAVEMQFQ